MKRPQKSSIFLFSFIASGLFLSCNPTLPDNIIQTQHGPMACEDFYFDLGDHPADEDYIVYAGQKEYKLEQYTPSTTTTLVKYLDSQTDTPTHVVKNMCFPLSKPMRVQIRQRSDKHGLVKAKQTENPKESLVTVMIVVPSARNAPTKGLAQYCRGAQCYSGAHGTHSTSNFTTWYDSAAKSLVWHTPQIMNLVGAHAVMIEDKLKSTCANEHNALSQAIFDAGPHGWYQHVSIVSNGQFIVANNPLLAKLPQKPGYQQVNPKALTGTGNFYRYDINSTLQPAQKLLTQCILKTVHNEPSLNGQAYCNKASGNTVKQTSSSLAQQIRQISQTSGALPVGDAETCPPAMVRKPNEIPGATAAQIQAAESQQDAGAVAAHILQNAQFTNAQSTALIDELKRILQVNSVSNGGYTFTLQQQTPQSGANCSIDSVNGAQVNMKCNNWFIRHLGTYVTFYDSNNQVVPGDQTVFNGCTQPYTTSSASDSTFLGTLSPPLVILGIPIGSDSVEMCFNMPQGATTAAITLGGLGNGGRFRDPQLEAVGIAMTAVAELGIPTFLLALTAGLFGSPEPLEAALGAREVVNFFIDLGVAINNNEPISDITQTVGENLLSIIVSTVMDKVLVWVLSQVVIGEVEKEIPFAGWVLNAIAIITTAAELAQTIVEVILSPFIIANSVVRTHDVLVNLDPTGAEFPPQADKYRVTLKISNADVQVAEGSLPATGLSQPIPVTFHNVPAGGNLTVSAQLVASSSGWVAGAHTPVSFSNFNNAPVANPTRLEINLPIKNSLVPLCSYSTYAPRQTLAYNMGSDQYLWQATTTPPRATVTNLYNSAFSGAPNSATISELDGLTLNENSQALGYSWRTYSPGLSDASGNNANTFLYANQSISIGGNPEQLHALQVDASGNPVTDANGDAIFTTRNAYKFSKCNGSPCGYVNQTALAYEFPGKQDGSGNNFVIVPKTDANGVTLYYVRQAALDGANTFNFDNTKNYGAFPFAQDRVVVHPSGYLVGLSTLSSKMSVIALPNQPSNDGVSTTVMATIYSHAADTQDAATANYNALFNPKSIAISHNGTIYVLEQYSNTQGRVHAMATSGNPVKAFAQNSKYTTLLKDHNSDFGGQPITLLDIAVENTGYVYVLYLVGDGTSVSNYYMDLYTPELKWLNTTSSIPAAKIAVDLERNVYSLNYDYLVGRYNVAQPSITQWIPPAPHTASGGCN